MVIKSFLGETVASALKQIRSELGPKAVVLKTRSLNANDSGIGRRMVEITACLERPTIGALEASFTEQKQTCKLKWNAATKMFQLKSSLKNGVPR